jgi:hypothetical protein
MKSNKYSNYKTTTAKQRAEEKKNLIDYRAAYE